MNHLKNQFCPTMTVALILSALVLIPAGAQEPHQAGLVVQFGEGRTETRCIEFSEEQISGYKVLLRSGLEVVVAGDVGMGSVVCSVDGEGCPPDNCWCQCKSMGSDCTYWSYWHLDGDWVYSQMGMGGHFVSHGDVEGWHWGKTEPPPAISFEEICAPPATDTPTPTVTSTPTRTPTPMPTVTPAPTATYTPSPTALPPTDTPWPTDTPPPTATAMATQVPVSTSTTEALLQVATAPAASSTAAQKEVAAQEDIAVQEEEAVQDGEAPPADTQMAATVTPLPAIDTPAAAPTLTVQSAGTAIPENRQTPTPAPTAPPPTETPTLESMAPPTQTPVAVALATVSTGETEGASSQSSGNGESGERTNSWLAILSIGAAVAHLFFGLFVVILTAIFVVVRRR